MYVLNVIYLADNEPFIAPWQKQPFAGRPRSLARARSLPVLRMAGGMESEATLTAEEIHNRQACSEVARESAACACSYSNSVLAPARID